MTEARQAEERVVGYVNGQILTQDAVNRVASAMLISGDRIVSVGETERIEHQLPAEAERVDLGRRVVIPGFVDAHCHLELTTTHLAYAVQCFVPPHASIADIQRTLRAAAAEAPPGEWLIGRADFSVHLFVEDERPILRSDLDAAVSDRPVVVFSGLHFFTLNTRALEVTGLLEGASISRGAAIDLETGRGAELWDWLPIDIFGREQIAAAIERLGTSMYRARGVTSIGELPFTHNGIHAYQELWRAGKLPARIDLHYHVPKLCSVDELAHVALETGFGDPWLRLGGVKVFVDGVGADPQGHAESDIKWSQSELDHIARVANDAGLQLWMHVQSEQAVDMALTAIERALAEAPHSDHRHRLEHMGDIPLPDAFWDRAAALEIVPIATPQFIYSYGDWYPEVNDPPLRTLRRRGFRVPGNSDSTGTQPKAANPFFSIWAAVSRRTRKGKALSPEERLDVEDALRMFTADAAWACHMDDRGTLEPGKLADFVVLGKDPRKVDVDELPEIPVDMTVTGGKVWTPQ